MIIAVDTGGTKTLVASFDKHGVLGPQIKFETPKDPIEYVKLLQSTIQQNYSGKLVDAIVVAIPGIIKKGGVCLAPILPPPARRPVLLEAQEKSAQAH